MNLRQLGLTLAMLFSVSLEAQDPEKGKAPASASGWEPSPVVKSTLRSIAASFQRPLHPLLHGVVPGGGVGAGIGYKAPLSSPWVAEASAVATVRRFWSVQAGAGYRGERAKVETYARSRDMPELSFFGPSPDSRLGDRTSFRLRERVLGALGSVRVAPWMRVGGRVEELWPDVNRGRESGLPSIEDRFDEARVPGLATQAREARYEAFIDLDVPAALGEALHQGTQYRMAYAIFSDRESERFSFRRLEIEARQRFALFGPYRRLTLHGLVSTIDADVGHDVPFYLQPTLGAKGYLRSVHDDLLGSDGTRATLRSFRDYRFRDRHLLLLQAEYRIPIWGLVDATAFADAGKVTSRRGDLGLGGLKRSYGVSLSIMRRTSTAARVDVAVGGGEGARVLLSFGGGDRR
ncbi:MAG: hypothetical protein ACT4P7_05910 [Gemmatimonadaceae bacterium]